MKISLFYVVWFENKVVELQIRTLFLGAESSFSEKGFGTRYSQSPRIRIPLKFEDIH